MRTEWQNWIDKVIMIKFHITKSPRESFLTLCWKSDHLSYLSSLQNHNQHAKRREINLKSHQNENHPCKYPILCFEGNKSWKDRARTHINQVIRINPIEKIKFWTKPNLQKQILQQTHYQQNTKTKQNPVAYHTIKLLNKKQ